MPEKIYLQVCGDCQDDECGNCEFEDLEDNVTWCKDKIFDKDVEYTHTELFIEKALKWYCRDCECNDNCDANHKCAFRDFFEMYLEGNDKALPPKISSALNPDGSTTENYRYRHFIERIQNDFVEKAISWLKEQDEIIGVSFQEDFLERFKNYMYNIK